MPIQKRERAFGELTGSRADDRSDGRDSDDHASPVEDRAYSSEFLFRTGDNGRVKAEEQTCEGDDGTR